MTIFTAPLETRVKLRDRSFQMGDVARPHHSNPDLWLVSSATHSTDAVKVFYRVSLSTGTCTCEGHRQRGICRHVARVSWELHRSRAVPTNIIQFPVAA